MFIDKTHEVFRYYHKEDMDYLSEGLNSAWDYISYDKEIGHLNTKDTIICSVSDTIEIIKLDGPTLKQIKKEVDSLAELIQRYDPEGDLKDVVNELSDSLRDIETDKQLRDAIYGIEDETNDREGEDFEGKWKRKKDITELFEKSIKKAVEVSPFIRERLKKAYSSVRARSAIYLGKFIPSKAENRIGKIVIYKKAIELMSGRNGIAVNDLLESTILHETFHANHYAMFKKTRLEHAWFDAFGEKDRTLVLESLASWYENNYCRNWKLSKQHEKEWRDLDINVWPYSGALVIKGIKPFLGLFRKTLLDWMSIADIIRELYYYEQNMLVKEYIASYHSDDVKNLAKTL